MITLTVILVFLGIMLFVVSIGAAFLLDPLIAIFGIYGIGRLAVWIKKKLKG